MPSGCRSASPTTRSLGLSVLRAHGAQMTDKDGNITVKSDATKQVLEWFKKLVPVLPPDVFAWDDASNNKALISGQSSLIFNPPSAWAVAVRDAPKVAEQLWTFPTPKGPKGHFRAGGAVLLGRLALLKEHTGSQEPLGLSVSALISRADRRGEPRL